MTRDERLYGPTYMITMDDGRPLYITINHDAAGEPVEVFIRYDDPALFEWVTLTTTLITRLLRAGQSLETIAEELKEIHSPRTRHILPGSGNRMCPSLAARFGEVFAEHLKRKEVGL